jgi:hypothetical protein
MGATCSSAILCGRCSIIFMCPDQGAKVGLSLSAYRPQIEATVPESNVQVAGKIPAPTPWHVLSILTTGDTDIHYSATQKGGLRGS